MEIRRKNHPHQERIPLEMILQERIPPERIPLERILLGSAEILVQNQLIHQILAQILQIHLTQNLIMAEDKKWSNALKLRKILKLRKALKSRRTKKNKTNMINLPIHTYFLNVFENHVTFFFTFSFLVDF